MHTNPWHSIKKEKITSTCFDACIEISKGSKNKYELDKESGLLRLDRVLYTSTSYPQNYGFIPRTYASDKDPLDVLVLCSEPILPMSLVECTPIGVMVMMDNGVADEKIIAVCKNDPVYRDFKDIKDLPHHVMEEIKHFFTVYKTLEGKETAVQCFKNRESAMKIIKSAIKAYEKEIEPRILADIKNKYCK